MASRDILNSISYISRESMVGLPVVKWFIDPATGDGRFYLGEVISWDSNEGGLTLYEVYYEDGDWEELYYFELEEILVRELM